MCAKMMVGPNIEINDKNSLTFIDESNICYKSRVDSIRLGYAFANCLNLKHVDLSSMGLVFINDIHYVFRNCANLTDVNLGKIDTSKVMSMFAAFADCVSLKMLDISSFDTSNVIDFSFMFANCSSLEELNLGPKFVINTLAKMNDMFVNCQRLKTVRMVPNDGLSANKIIRQLSGNWTYEPKTGVLSKVETTISQAPEPHVQTIDNRPEVIFLNIAEEISKFSKCVSKQVGCVIVKYNRIISTGCNGTPSGAVNCDSIFDREKIPDPEYRACHHQFSDSMECHAEENAILNAAYHGISIANSTFFISLKPCESCLKKIIALGVKSIFYRHEYDRFIEYSDYVSKMIADLDIKITKIK